jgi:Eco57I restriction-modification methylase
MPVAVTSDWKEEFGIQDRTPPAFFSDQEEIDAAGAGVPQPHALRRAFQQLELDGVLCQDRTPIIYFRRLEQIKPGEVATLHRLFWNQGVAPILVLIAPDQVHVYSGLAEPILDQDLDGRAGFVETLRRVTRELQSFILAVESGEYFRSHRKSFDPQQRVDRNLLRNLRSARERLDEVSAPRLSPQILDALLCRLVFTCYLFDRGVIDRDYLAAINISGANHLRDILGRKPRSTAKLHLYKLFEQLSWDFNGDLFNDDLETEIQQIEAEHLDILDQFFRAADVRSGQESFWPYDFGIIPIETVSAIYEHFLKAAGEEAKKEAGAFYTPRFLAELVLDLLLDGGPALLDKRFLDPSCGSGIFLVGLFNRLAEEWKRANPTARYDRRATELMRILTTNLYGIDRNQTACRITAFSLYLAFLDQLSPPDIRRLQSKGKMLPFLRRSPDAPDNQGHTILCADFFTDDAELSQTAHFVVGNPPWGSIRDRTAPAVRWCAERALPFPDRQAATAFVWKAPRHLEPGGKVCFVLPCGVLFNHNTPALEFQREWMRRHAVERVLNLADYQRFLFEESEAPALVVRYAHDKPANSAHRIDYWAPKADWGVIQAELVTVLTQDRSRLTVRDVLDDLEEMDAPQVWKERLWATPRDWRLLNRLFRIPRLRDHVRQPRETAPAKPWIIAEGYQPIGQSDAPSRGKEITLPSKWFIGARSGYIDLLLLEGDCKELPSETIHVREKSNKNTAIFAAPHVLVTKGFQKVAFADFPVSFHDPIRGIHGPESDHHLLVFLAAYLRSPLARYFQFHTSSNWGVGWQKVDVTELLRIPFPRPEQQSDPRRSAEIVYAVATIVTHAAQEASRDFADRTGVVRNATTAIASLIEEYFDIDDVERMLIEDTNTLLIPSVRPTRRRVNIPTILPSTEKQRAEYTRLLCETLNAWATQDQKVHGRATAHAGLGVGLVVLEKTRQGELPHRLNGLRDGVLATLHGLQRTATQTYGTLQLARGLKVFDKSLLYITKPIGQRFWTRTAALNDADEIAGTILFRSAREGS